MVGNREIIIGRISLKAFDGAFLFSDDEDMVNGFFKGTVIILCCIAPREAIVIADIFFGIFHGNIVRVTEAVLQKILCRF